jgi:hypothetical protein
MHFMTANRRAPGQGLRMASNSGTEVSGATKERVLGGFKNLPKCCKRERGA